MQDSVENLNWKAELADKAVTLIHRFRHHCKTTAGESGKALQVVSTNNQVIGLSRVSGRITHRGTLFVSKSLEGWSFVSK